MKKKSSSPITVEDIEEKIRNCETDIELVKNQKNFPFVYISFAFPITGLFIVGSIISEGIIDLFNAVIGGLFFSLLFTCVYIVAYQPNKDELEQELKQDLKYLRRLKNKLLAGKKGEQEIAYYLKWLKEPYMVLNDINLQTENYEPQQFDHIVIGPNGIIHIETKNINGKIIISNDGDWVLEKKLKTHTLTEGMESPHHQVKRHSLVLRELLEKSFAHKKVNIEGIVAMANSRTIIEGKDPVLNIVKKDKLVHAIENTESKTILTDKEIRKIAVKIISKSQI